jgi:diacylglycerol kinase (ATP)
MAVTALAPLRSPARLRGLAPHVLLVANANASGIVRRPELVGGAASLLRGAGARVERLLTSSLDELRDVLAAAERRVVLLGGDGSLHAAANAGAAARELAILPAGRANNLARSLGIPLDLGAAARVAVAGRARPLDAIAARTPATRRLALEGVSVGFHAQARAGYHATNSADVGAAAKTGLRALARFAPLALGLDVDGDGRSVRVAQLFVVNTPFFGPGLRVAPGADPADGRLELVTLEAESRGALLALIPHLRRGTHIGRPGVRRVSAERIRIATGGRSPVIADTVDLGPGMVELTVERGALSVVR